MAPETLAAALEASALGQWMRSGGAYPAANLLHLLGLSLLVGPILLLDLRLLGLGRGFALPEVSRVLTPFAVAGLALLLLSGMGLLAADARSLLAHPLMRLKLLLVAFGVANALLFRALWRTRLHDWDRRPPRWGRLQALASVLGWIGAAAAGRLIAYV
ncbi:hypothetical protein [Vulcaniibacterium tengchongense]|uniref:Uncharacterized protein n=1 Tax=Vulcaniibacterium tengchongense TaxID=1273429 RepID=A0A3N4V2K5_9GAMM|nr:hypothetical protein [Vulcaniibacterium tengchongense]RPE77186.1 hypothetical protein EDC50_2451 [Vulcaniibacterium tengchongense]